MESAITCTMGIVHNHEVRDLPIAREMKNGQIFTVNVTESSICFALQPQKAVREVLKWSYVIINSL